MTTPLVERVGAAVIRAVENVAFLDDSMREVIGRAAIEAMREPTQEMLDACGNGEASVWALGSWLAMVHAALGKGEA